MGLGFQAGYAIKKISEYPEFKDYKTVMEYGCQSIAYLNHYIYTKVLNYKNTLSFKWNNYFCINQNNITIKVK